MTASNSLLDLLPADDRAAVAAVLAAHPGEGAAAGPALDGRACWVALKLDGAIAGMVLASIDDPAHAEDLARTLAELLALSVNANREADRETATLLKKARREN